jgi:DNA primase
MIETFHLGYANQNQVVLELMKNYTLEDIKNSGIISMGNYDRLRNRIIFPIFNEKKECISFGGRTLKDEKPKYINSNETDVFHKGLSLYNVNYLATSYVQIPIIYLVEGYIDVIIMYKYGYPNTVASMGTSVSKSQLFIILKRTKKICLIFDGDEAGEKAAERTINILLTMINSTYEIIICSLPKGADPDNFLRNNLPKDMENFYKNLFDYLISNIIKDLDLKNPRDVSDGFERLYNYINNIENPSLKASYKLLLENKLKDLIYETKRNSEKKIIKKTLPYISNREENIIMIIVSYPDLLHEFVEHLALVGFKDFELDKIKNNLLLHYNTSNFNNILLKFQEETRIKNLLENNRLLLLKKDFCKKYLYDLLCLIPINTNDIKFI